MTWPSPSQLYITFTIPHEKSATGYRRIPLHFCTDENSHFQNTIHTVIHRDLLQNTPRRHTTLPPVFVSENVSDSAQPVSIKCPRFDE